MSAPQGAAAAGMGAAAAAAAGMGAVWGGWGGWVVGCCQGRTRERGEPELNKGLSLPDWYLCICSI